MEILLYTLNVCKNIEVGKRLEWKAGITFIKMPKMLF